MMQFSTRQKETKKTSPGSIKIQSNHKISTKSKNEYESVSRDINSQLFDYKVQKKERQQPKSDIIKIHVFNFTFSTKMKKEKKKMQTKQMRSNDTEN